jgi:hypothetical protein
MPYLPEGGKVGLEEGYGLIEKFRLTPNRVQALMHMCQRQQQVHECIQSTGASPVSVALRNRHEDYDVTILMALRNPLLYRDDFLMEEQSFAGLDNTLMLQTGLARVPCRGIVNLRTLDGLFEKHANPLSVVKVHNHVLQMQWTEECLFLMERRVRRSATRAVREPSRSRFAAGAAQPRSHGPTAARLRLQGPSARAPRARPVDRSDQGAAPGHGSGLRPFVHG